MMTNEVNNLVDLLKRLCSDYGVNLVYMVVNNVEFEYDGRKDLTEYNWGVDVVDGGVVECSLKEFLDDNVVKSLTVEVQVKSSLFDVFNEFLVKECLDKDSTFVEMVYAQDETSCDYGVYCLDFTNRL